MFLEKILTFLESLSHIPQDEKEKFCKLFKARQLKKGDYFVQAGTSSTEFAFIEQGLFRFFYITLEGQEFNMTFKRENDHMLSYYSILVGDVSNFSIQAMEDSIIHVGNFKEFEKFYDSHPCWQEIGRKIAEMNFIIKSKREESFLLYDAPTRYEQFCQTYPDLIKRLPQMHIALYLGVSPETLNRIIKKKDKLHN